MAQGEWQVCTEGGCVLEACLCADVIYGGIGSFNWLIGDGDI